MTITESSAPRIRLTSQLFAGLLLAALGMLFTLDNLQILRAREVLRYWPAIFLVIGISQLVQARSIGTMIGGSIWIVFGSVLLGERLHLISSGLRFWPLLLVAVGVWIMVRSMTAAGPSGVTDSSARLSALAVLGGVDRRVTAEGFQGADITAFMIDPFIGALPVRTCALQGAGPSPKLQRSNLPARFRNERINQTISAPPYSSRARLRRRPRGPCR